MACRLFNNERDEYGHTYEIDDSVRTFCFEVASGNAPIYVQVIPHSGAKQDDCFLNVRKVVRSKGGQIAYGWTIWIWPRVLFDAEHHAVWQKPDGTLVDITPKADREKRILFLPDPGRTYDFETGRRLDNIRKAITDDDDVRAFISYAAQVSVIIEQNRIAPDQVDVTRDIPKLKQLQGQIGIVGRRILAKYC